MKYTLITMIAISAALFGFDLQPVDIETSHRIDPPARFESASPDSGVIETAEPRHLLTFDFPADYFGEDNLIIEAVLEIEIEELPSLSPSEGAVLAPLEAICVPVTSSPGGTPSWAAVESAYDLRYAEFGTYNAETGTVTFEISRILYAANEGELDFHGVMIIPSAGSRKFRVADRESSVGLQTANFIGGRAVRD